MEQDWNKWNKWSGRVGWGYTCRMAKTIELTAEQKELAGKLTHLQRMFVINLVKGSMSNRAAYRAAGGKGNDKTVDASAARMLALGKVKAFYDSLVGSAVTDAIMSRDEAMNILSRMARVGVKDVAKFGKLQVGEGADGEPVYQSVWEMKDDTELEEDPAIAISELSAGREGFKFKLHDRRAAIKQLGDMMGWNAPAKHEHSGPDGGPIETKDLTDEEVARRVAFMLFRGVQ